MKAAVLTGIRKIEIRDIHKPRLKRDTDVLLRVSAAGLCGSDIHYYAEGRIGDQVVRYPFIVGHECAGVVEEAGSSVQGLKPGDRVAVDPAVVCGTCDQCLAGRPNTCRRLPGRRDQSHHPQWLRSRCPEAKMREPERGCFRLSNP